MTHDAACLDTTITFILSLSEGEVPEETPILCWLDNARIQCNVHPRLSHTFQLLIMYLT